MTLSEYIAGIKNKKIAVIGIGISNTPLIELLLTAGCDVTACDKTELGALGEAADRLEKKGAKLRLGADYLQALDADVIFRTPGMRPDLPELTEAIARGAELTSEMEVFFEVCPCRIIAVTGSDGKTTTTTIISRLLREDGYTVHIGGNIGTPLLCQAETMKADDIAVLELSSFQLLTMKKSPWIAVVTNLTPNHLDMHRDMEEYVEAKRNILRFQSASDIAVLNLDSDITRAFAETAQGEVRLFSRKSRVENGLFLESGTIFESMDGKIVPVMEASEIFLSGVHNIENYMAAFGAVRGLVSYETYRRVARELTGVEHRIELVRTFRGVKYYNDSIASGPTRTTAGLRSFDKKVILIAGGKDKGIAYDALGPEIVAHVKTLVLTGMTADKIRAAVLQAPDYRGTPVIIIKDDFKEAVLTAHKAAEDGDIVILSPASTAYDKFKNFEVRGNTYKAIINGLE